jgi:hypothetical protein
MSVVAAGRTLLAWVVIGTGVAAAQSDYVGRLHPKLKPTGGSPGCTISPARPVDLQRLPVAMLSGKVMTGLLPVSWLASGMRLALVEPVAGEPAMYADLDNDGRWTDRERLRSSAPGEVVDRGRSNAL